jgi:radical SAM protein with 4Fe4S-binding SPASM domain
VHCRRLDVSKELMKSDLTTEQAFAFLDDLASFAKPILVLSGGEPLFRPDIFDIARHAGDLGLPVALATNGTMIDPAKAQQIVDAGIQRVAISIDGADEQTHDNFRRLPGSLRLALNGVRNLRRLGMSMQINCTITRHNVHQVDRLYDIAIEEQVDALHLFMLVPVGCGVQIAESNMLPAEEYERVLNWMYDKAQLGDLHLKATCAPHYFRVMKQRQKEERGRVRGSAGEPVRTWGEGRRQGSAVGGRRSAVGGGGHPGGVPKGVHPTGMAAMTKGCLAGSAICFVSHTGEVFPCGYLPVSAGNVRKQSMESIWADSEVFERLRDDDQLEGKCGVCEYKRVCMGCRARAFYAENGNYMAEEPFCIYEPVRLRKQTELEASEL